MAENFYDRLDEILDGAHEGQKRNDTVDALNALYAERQTVEVERLRAELRDRRTDDLDVRGILKPAPGVGEDAVPMQLGHAVAPAIEWLVNDRDRLRAELAKRPKSRLGEQVNRLSNAVGDLEAERDDALGERDAAREQVKRVAALRDRWEAAVRDPSIYRNGGVEHAAALAASHLPDLRRALDGESGR